MANRERSAAAVGAADAVPRQCKKAKAIFNIAIRHLRDDWSIVMSYGGCMGDMVTGGFFIAVIVAFLYVISLGRDRILVVLVSVYLALAVISSLPSSLLSEQPNENALFRMTAFVAMFAILFFFISRSTLLHSVGVHAGRSRWYQTLIFAILYIGVFVSIAFSLLPPSIMDSFPSIIRSCFGSDWAYFLWIITPIIALILFGRSIEEE